MDQNAAAERALKLLRLAAPNSGTTDAERTSAALEAAKIIAESHLTVVAGDLPKTREDDALAVARAYSRAAARAAAEAGFYKTTRRPTPSRKEPRSPNGYTGANWDQVKARNFCLCVACGGSIFTGDEAWYDPHVGFRHYDITCNESHF